MITMLRQAEEELLKTQAELDVYKRLLKEKGDKMEG